MRKQLVGAAIAVGLVMGGGSVASGGEVVPSPTLEANPDTVTPGESVEISNAADSPCNGALVVGNFTVRPGAFSVVPDGDGNWSVDIGVPPNGPPTAMGEDTPFPPGEYEAFAHCYAVCPEQFEAQCGADADAAKAGPMFARGVAARQVADDFEYEPVTVLVVAEPEGPPPTDPATPTTAAPGDTTPTTAAPADEAVAAEAARATAARPTFTG